MKRKRTSLLFLDWPLVDRTLWLAANSKGGFLEPDGQALHWEVKTRNGVIKRYGKWLGYLVEADSLDPGCLPSMRISKKTLTGYVGWMRARGNATTTVANGIRDLKEALRVMEPDADLILLTELAATLKIRQKPVRQKQARILHPDKLLSGALDFLDGIPNGDYRNKFCRAGKYRDGLIVALLACRPIRLENVTEMVLGDQLIQEGDQWQCRFEASEMKEKRPLAFSFPQILVPYLETYITTYRSILLKGEESRDLWISTRGQRMSEQSVYWNTCRLTEELFGQRINPHLFRDCAASALATEDPEHILAIARILGHASIDTTMRHYNQSQMVAAADIYHQVMNDFKTENPHL
jgi:integrase/recombinase XerD